MTKLFGIFSALFIFTTTTLASNPDKNKNLRLVDAENAILNMVETSDLYVYQKGGFFTEPCSAEVEVDNNEFRFTVSKLQSLKGIDFRFDKNSGRNLDGDVVNVTAINSDYDKLKLRISFNVLRANTKTLEKLTLTIESKGSTSDGYHKAKITVQMGDEKYSCQGVEDGGY